MYFLYIHFLKRKIPYYWFCPSDINYASLFGINALHAQGGPFIYGEPGEDTVGGYLADAVGISTVFQLLGNQGGSAAAKKLSKKAAKKVAKRIISRSLRAVGAALAVYDFTSCMGCI